MVRTTRANVNNIKQLGGIIMGLFLLPLGFLLAWLYDKYDAKRSSKQYQEYMKEQKERLGLK